MQPRRWIVALSDDIAFYDLVEQEVQARTGALTKPAPCTTQEAFAAAACDCHAVAVGDFRLTEAVIAQLEHCLVLARIGAGVDPVDLEAARRLGIRVTNVPDYGMEDVASHALALMLALARRLPAYDRMIRSGRWDKVGAGTIHRVHGQTIGILGLGRIGKTFARQASAMGCPIIASDPYIEPEVFTSHGAEQVDFTTLIESSDFLSLHVPLTEETYHIIGDEELSRMKPTAYLVNTSRGAVVDQQALYQALKSGQIAGAGLDVFEDEPIAGDDKLLTLENAILTPHAAWYSEESQRTMAARTAEEIDRALRGQPARSPVVDPPLRKIEGV